MTRSLFYGPGVIRKKNKKREDGPLERVNVSLPVPVVEKMDAICSSGVKLTRADVILEGLIAVLPELERRAKEQGLL